MRARLKVKMSGYGNFVCELITALPYDSAVYAVVVCTRLSARLSQAGNSIETTGRIELGFFWHGSGFLSPILGCCLRKFGYLGNITLLPSGTLSQTLDSENFATASRSRCQRHSSSSSTVELVDDTYTTVDESWLFTTGRSAVTL